MQEKLIRTSCFYSRVNEPCFNIYSTRVSPKELHICQKFLYFQWQVKPLVDATNLKDNMFLEIISKTCNYGIGSILLLTTNRWGAKEYYCIKHMANELRLSLPSSPKILQQLTHYGILYPNI